MSAQFSPLTISILVLIVWVIIVFGGERLQTGADEAMQDLISKQFLYIMLIAPLFLLAVIAYEGWWREVGLEPGLGFGDAKLLVVPALMLVVIWTIAFSRKFLQGKRLVFAGANTFLVGISEELMFRGVFFHGVQSAFGAKWGVVITTLSFGLVHILNGLPESRNKLFCKHFLRRCSVSGWSPCGCALGPSFRSSSSIGSGISASPLLRRAVRRRKRCPSRNSFRLVWI